MAEELTAEDLIAYFLRRDYGIAFTEADIIYISKKIASELEPVQYPSGYEIIRQGEPGDAMFLIESGQLEVVRSPLRRGFNPRHVAYLGKGDVVGEMALIYGEPRNADIVAKTDVRAYRLSEGSWIRIETLYPAFAARVRDVADKRRQLLTNF